MIGHADNGETLNEPISGKASSYRHIIGALTDKLEGGILCLKNVPITHNGGRHCILIIDLSMDRALGVRLDAAIERFNRMKDMEIAISRDDITIKERLNYSYIVVVQQGKVKAELP